MWTRAEENIAAKRLRAVTDELFGGSEPVGQALRRRCLRALLAANRSPAVAEYLALRGEFLAHYGDAVTAVVSAMTPRASARFHDLHSVANEALLDAFDAWQPRPNIRFFSFAYMVIRLRLLQNIRARLRESAVYVAARQRHPDNPYSPSPEESLVDDETQRLDLAWLQQALRHLSSRQRIVVDLLFRQRQSTEEAARALGVSNQAISALKLRALRTLRTLREAP